MCWNIRGSGATAISSDNASGADNQQERPIAEMRAESSETIRRTSARVSDEEMVPSAWRHAGVVAQGRLLTRSNVIEEGNQRNSLSGKTQTCPRVKRFTRASPAHIGEALTDLAEGPRVIPREVLVTP